MNEWERKLTLFSRTFDEWVSVQRNWLYLETVFAAQDIQRFVVTSYFFFFKSGGLYVSYTPSISQTKIFILLLLLGNKDVGQKWWNLLKIKEDLFVQNFLFSDKNDEISE